MEPDAERTLDDDPERAAIRATLENPMPSFRSRLHVIMSMQKLHYMQAVVDDLHEQNEMGVDFSRWKATLEQRCSLVWPRRQLEAELRWQLQLAAQIGATAAQSSLLEGEPDASFRLIVSQAQECEQHVHLQDFTASAGHEVWLRLTPPLSYGCRCIRVVDNPPVSSQAMPNHPPPEPARGFDFYPVGNADLTRMATWMQQMCDPDFDHPFSSEWPLPRHDPTELPLIFWLAPPAPERRSGGPWQPGIDAVFDSLWAHFADFEPVDLGCLRSAIAEARDEQSLRRNLGALASQLRIGRNPEDQDIGLQHLLLALQVGIDGARENAAKGMIRPFHCGD